MDSKTTDPARIKAQLLDIASSGDFEERSAELTDVWSREKAGLETVEPVLRFIEEHPYIDFGTPGALVHFVERFYGNGYEEKLVESVRRKPTPLTAWMLNRVINGTKAADIRQQLLAIMEEARLNPLADDETQSEIDDFLRRHGR